ncbi:MAG: hypothetical protein COB59_11725 [Rhodospirillaceae bacterium]|nr:MAG: hypothetical protein COB59_11725 [Rhodospirillaceae bacterium]
MKKIAILVLAAFGLAGCAVYNVAGQFEGTGQAFVGTVTVALGDGGSLEVTSLDGRLHCTGTSQVTKRPSGYTTVGGQGRAQATCNDGTTFKVDFIQSSESGGSGQGIDSNGQIVTLFFDKSEGMARTRMNRQRLDALVQ